MSTPSEYRDRIVSRQMHDAALGIGGSVFVCGLGTSDTYSAFAMLLPQTRLRKARNHNKASGRNHLPVAHHDRVNASHASLDGW